MGFNLPSLQRELRKRRVAVVFVTLALADCVAYVAMRGRGDVQAGLYQLTGLACVAGLMLGRRRAGARGFWWLLFPAAVTLDVTGDAAWLLHDSLGLRAVPARLSDGLYLGAYPVFAASLLCIGGARRDELSMLVRDLVDAGIVFCAGLPVLWFAGIDPVVGAGGIHGGDEILAVTYPILDLVLLALLLRLAFSAVRWSPAYLLLTTGFAATFVGDIVWRELLARGSYGAGSCVNVLFLAGYGLWGAAALEPSAAMLERTAAALSCVPPRRRLLLLAVAVATPGIVIPIAHHRLSGTIDVAVLAACAASIPLLGLVRTADMVGSIHEALRHEQEARAALGATIAAAPVPVCVIGEGGAIRLWNAAAEEMSGWRAEEIVGRALASLPGQSAAAVLELYRQALAGVRHRAASARLSRRNGDPVDLRISTAVLPGADSSVVAMFEDVTAELRQAERLEYLAAHDPLTGLANRRKFEAALEAATAGGERAALVFFDLDNFKLVNDSGGHSAGDRMLVDVSKILSGATRAHDLVARLSGDEFAILAAAGPDDVDAITTRILQNVRDYRLLLHDEIYDITMSAGIYGLREGDTPAQALLRADQALYEAKARGKNKSYRWQESLPHVGASRAWSPRLKDALRDGRLEAHLQPIVSLRSREVVFCEALCRLREPNGNLSADAGFIGAAEALGLVPEIDCRMLEQVHALLRGDARVPIFVNLSASSFSDARVEALLARILAHVPRGSLGIEITEHVSVGDLDLAGERIRSLRRLGALVAIDDFGQGFFSFPHLARLSCDLVKIPATVSADPKGNRRDTVVAAIASVAHAYGKAVVLEGIEDAQTAERAAATGIEFGQGWFFGRPGPSRETLARAVPAVRVRRDDRRCGHAARARVGPAPRHVR